MWNLGATRREAPEKIRVSGKQVTINTRLRVLLGAKRLDFFETLDHSVAPGVKLRVLLGAKRLDFLKFWIIIMNAARDNIESFECQSVPE